VAASRGAPCLVGQSSSPHLPLIRPKKLPLKIGRYISRNICSAARSYSAIAGLLVVGVDESAKALLTTGAPAGFMDTGGGCVADGSRERKTRLYAQKVHDHQHIALGGRMSLRGFEVISGKHNGQLSKTTG
jgi:hypothetical protein